MDADAGVAPPFLSALPDESSFDLLAGDSVNGEVKYLARVQGAAPIEPLLEACYFQHTQRYPWHVQFLQEFSSLGGALTYDQYRTWVLRKATRRLWGGTLHRWPQVVHPTRGVPGLITYDLYSEPNGLDVAAISEVDQLLKQCMPFARERLVWVAGGDDQEALLTRERANLEQRGIVALRSSDLTYMRFRSSTNVEDLDAFTGAGLYDSKSGCLADDLDGDAVGPSACLTQEKAADLERQRAERLQELAEHPERTYLQDILDDIEGDLSDEKPVADALRKVWASLWNERAFDERGYYGIDHRLAYMAVAVHPTYALERANAVVVSNLHVDDGPPLYRVNSQVGELSVVTPEDPNAVAEMLTFRREHDPPEATDIRVSLGSSLLLPGGEVWPRVKLLELAQLIFRVHDHFAREVYPQLSPLSLDFEVKLERNDQVAIKQVRPYVSTDP